MLKAINRVILASALSTLLFTTTALAGETYDAPNNSSFKSYMDYRSITKTNSPQHIIQQNSITDEEGFRKFNGCYTVAVGTGWNAPVGTYIDVQLDNGTILHSIVGDIKANKDTGPDNKQVLKNGNVVEFIVDTRQLDSVAKKLGDVSCTGKVGDIDTITIRDSAPIQNVTVEEAIVEFANNAISDNTIDITTPTNESGTTTFEIKTADDFAIVTY